MLKPAYYFPLSNGKYSVRTGFSSLEKDFGNGAQDHKLFQLDTFFDYYRNQKLKSRRESLSKYFCVANSDDEFGHILSFISNQLCKEYPDYFQLNTSGGNNYILNCRHSGDQLVFNKAFNLVDYISPVVPGYSHAIDALACQIQEDFAIVEFSRNFEDKLLAIHLCFPNHWAAGDKIGHDFATIHAPVPGITAISSKSPSLYRGVQAKGPFVRFAWGLSTDRYLNHHPQAPAGLEQALWTGRSFDINNPMLFIRVERQVSYCLESKMLFTIRTYFIDCAQIKSDKRQCRQLIGAIESMSSDVLRYKGIYTDRENILEWLKSG